MSAQFTSFIILVFIMLNNSVYCVNLITLSDQCQKAYENECVRLQNTLRARHSAPPLRSNSTISQEAIKYANHLAESNTLNVSQQHVYGENLAVYYSPHSLNQSKCESITYLISSFLKHFSDYFLKSFSESIRD